MSGVMKIKANGVEIDHLAFGQFQGLPMAYNSSNPNVWTTNFGGNALLFDSIQSFDVEDGSYDLTLTGRFKLYNYDPNTNLVLIGTGTIPAFNYIGSASSGDSFNVAPDGSITASLHGGPLENFFDDFDSLVYSGSNINDQYDATLFPAGANMFGYGGNDYLFGAIFGVNRIYGGEGNDNIYGQGLGDRLYGDAGNDYVSDEDSKTTVIDNMAHYSRDWLYGGEGNDHLLGQGGSDFLFGNEGDDELTISSDRSDTDFLDGGTGADLMSGGKGNDTYYVDNRSDKINEFQDGGADTVQTTVSYVLEGGQYIETLRVASDTSTFAINLIGNEFANKLVGNAGANVLNGGIGTDILYGKGGNDTFFVDIATDKVFEAVGEGSDTVRTSVSYVLSAGQEIESLRTTSDAGTEVINLTGNEIVNTLVGNAGANVLAGGGSSDSLFGRGGADTFLYKTLADSTVAAAGRDTIQDFSIAQGDRIDLHLIDAIAGDTANQAFNFIGTAKFHNLAGELRAMALGGNTLVNGDVNGDGTADFSILLKGALALQAGDFIL